MSVDRGEADQFFPSISHFDRPRMDIRSCARVSAIVTTALYLGTPLRPCRAEAAADRETMAQSVCLGFRTAAASRAKIQFSGVGELRTYIGFRYSAFQ